jgi:hypothetical protein
MVPKSHVKKWNACILGILAKYHGPNLQPLRLLCWAIFLQKNRRTVQLPRIHDIRKNWPLWLALKTFVHIEVKS